MDAQMNVAEHVPEAINIPVEEDLDNGHVNVDNHGNDIDIDAEDGDHINNEDEGNIDGVVNAVDNLDLASTQADNASVREEPDDLASLADVEEIAQDINKLVRGETSNESSLCETIIDTGIKYAYASKDVLMKVTTNLNVQKTPFFNDLIEGTCIIPLEIKGIMLFFLTYVTKFNMPMTIGIDSIRTSGFHLSKDGVNCPKLLKNNVIVDALKLHLLSTKRVIFSIRSKMHLSHEKHKQYVFRSHYRHDNLDSFISRTYLDKTLSKDTIQSIYTVLDNCNSRTRISPDISFIERHLRENIFLSQSNGDDYVDPPNYLLHEKEFEAYFASKNSFGKKKLQISKAQVRHLHLRLGHISSKKLMNVLRGSYKITKSSENLINSEIEKCNTCAATQNKPASHRIALPKARSFNDYIELDLKVCQGYYILYIVDSLTSYLTAKIIKNKESRTVYDAMISSWISIFGIPHSGIATDQGNEFTSSIFQQFCASNSLRHFLSSPGYPEGNGKIERCHFQADLVMKKIKLDCPDWTPEQLLERAVWAYNSTPAGHLNIAPLFAVTGQAGKLMSLDLPNPCVENETEQNLLGNILHSLYSARKAILNSKYCMISRKLLEGRHFPRKEFEFFPGQMVFYYDSRKLCWLIGKIVNFFGSTCDLKTTNGFIKNVPQIRLRPFHDKWTLSDKMHDLTFDTSELEKDKDFIENSQELNNTQTDMTDQTDDRQEIIDIDRQDSVIEDKFYDMSEISPEKNSEITIVFKGDLKYHYDVIVKKITKKILTFYDIYDKQIKNHKRDDLMFKYSRSGGVDRDRDQGEGHGRAGEVRQRTDDDGVAGREDDGGNHHRWRFTSQADAVGLAGVHPDAAGGRCHPLLHGLYMAQPAREWGPDIRPHEERLPGGGECHHPRGARVERPQAVDRPGDHRHDQGDPAQDVRNIRPAPLPDLSHGDTGDDQGGPEVGDGLEHLPENHRDPDTDQFCSLRPVASERQAGIRVEGVCLLQADEILDPRVAADDQGISLRFPGLCKNVLHHEEGRSISHNGPRGPRRDSRCGAHRGSELPRLEAGLGLHQDLHAEPERGQRSAEDRRHQEQAGADQLSFSRQSGHTGGYPQIEDHPPVRGQAEEVELRPGRGTQRPALPRTTPRPRTSSRRSRRSRTLQPPEGGTGEKPRGRSRVRTRPPEEPRALQPPELEKRLPPDEILLEEAC